MDYPENNNNANRNHKIIWKNPYATANKTFIGKIIRDVREWEQCISTS